MKVGDIIEVRVAPYIAMWQCAELLIDDTHPLDDGKVKVKLLDSVALPLPEIWVDQRHVRSRDERS